MRDYKELYRQDGVMPDPDQVRQDIDEAVVWESAYRIGDFMYEIDSDMTDRLVMEAYEKAFRLGLNTRVNKEYFLEATKRLAGIYFRFQKYEEAVNKLMLLDAHLDEVPDWVNLYFAAAQIHTESLLYWAECPQIFFKRIDGIDPADPDSVRKRTALYLEFLNRLTGMAEDGSAPVIDGEAILAKADELGLSDTRECLEFQFAFGLTEDVPEFEEELIVKELFVKETKEVYKTESIPETEETVLPDEALCEKIAELEAVIEKLQAAADRQQDLMDRQSVQILKLQEELKEREAAANDSPQPAARPPLQDVLKVDNFLPKRQKILIIGGSQAKESHLRGKLKSMGFDFSKDQLEFELDYDSVKDYASRIVPWSGKYAGIIVGPCPHKVKDSGDYSSFIEKMKYEEGYPHIEEARDKSGSLKISNASIGEAMMRMAVHLLSIAS